MAAIIDGKAAAAKHREIIARRAASLRRPPGLAVVLIGDDPASHVYVKNKHNDCKSCGITAFDYRLPAETTQAELIELVSELNRREDVDGILVQSPMPKHICEPDIYTAIDPGKDVDVFHPYNAGLVMQGSPRFSPCTPAGVMLLLDEYNITVEGKECVVVGRSDKAGKPQAMMLLHQNGTVTICHSRTPDLASVTRRADILVSAVGKLGLITGSMIKPGAVVIDVGMNKKPDGKLAGDVVFSEAEAVASYITPVPGGVGPMTRVVLLYNTLASAEARI
jgi:methylenetetrahydrofolate dehydrogenase (NADP+)/methenyltetrahydrofolate cyclohydrolase